MNFQGMTYVAGQSLVHRCDARVKIVLLFAYSIAIFLVQTWWAMGAFAAAACVLAAVGRIPVKRLLVPLVPVLVFSALAVVFATVASPDVDGLLRGLFLAVRMIALTLASFIVCFTTTATELLDGFAWLIGPLRKVGVPVDDIAFTLSLAVRFIPVIAEEFVMVRKAQAARGATVDGASFRRRLEVWGATFSAVFVGLFRHADALATAMDARCFGTSDRRTRW